MTQKQIETVKAIEHRDMTSLEIAELTGKDHSKVLRDIRDLQEELSGFAVNGGEAKFGLSSYTNSQNKKLPMYRLDSTSSLTLLTGYMPKLRFALICRWEELETKEHIKGDSKEAYKHLMQIVLEESEDKKMSAIKVATTVNKAVSNYFGFDKMVKKDNMSDEMLALRIKVLEDYEKAFEMFSGTDMNVKEFIYSKYSQPKIEGK